MAQLRVDRVRIPHRPPASLVDLSSGGALLELPYQVQPEARFAVELYTPVERVEVPFQLLRCYVAELKGGVTYHAAGAFENLLNLQAILLRASGAVQRLIMSLERLQQVGQKATHQSRRAGEFNEVLAGVTAGLRRGESFDVVALKVKARLTQTYPSLAIVPSLSPAKDVRTSLACFGLTFKSRHPLSAPDRRFLRAHAQLISMLEECRGELINEVEATQGPQVIYSAADWLAAPSQPSTDSDQEKRARLAGAAQPWPSGSFVFSASA
jgi:hypothetical protein